MNRKRKDKQQEDQSQMAFTITAIVACLAVAVMEDTLYFATGVHFWSTGFHPVSIFAGAAVFLGLLYFLQRMHERRHALQYLEPAPLADVESLSNRVMACFIYYTLPKNPSCLPDKERYDKAATMIRLAVFFEKAVVERAVRFAASLNRPWSHKV